MIPPTGLDGNPAKDGVALTRTLVSPILEKSYDPSEDCD